MARTPIWLDTNILIRLDQWLLGAHGSAPYAGYEKELKNLIRDGHELLISPKVKTEFLFGGRKGKLVRTIDTVRRQKLLSRFGINLDTQTIKVSRDQISTWRNLGMKHGLSIEDATVISEVKAGGQARGIEKPVFLTRDGGGTLKAIRNRGVVGIEFRVAAESPPVQKPPTPAPPKLANPPQPLKTPSVRPSQTPAANRQVKLDGLKARLSRVRVAYRGSVTARIVGGFAFSVIMGLIGSWLQDRTDRKQIEGDLKRISSEVEAFLNSKEVTAEIAKAQTLCDLDEKVYVLYYIDFHHGRPTFKHPHHDYPLDATVSAWLGQGEEGIKILILSEQHKRFRDGVIRQGGTENHPLIEYYPQFSEVAVYTKDELDALQELQSMYLELKRKVMMQQGIPGGSTKDVEELENLREEITDQFGSDLWFLSSP